MLPDVSPHRLIYTCTQHHPHTPSHPRQHPTTPFLPSFLPHSTTPALYPLFTPPSITTRPHPLHPTSFAAQSAVNEAHDCTSKHEVFTKESPDASQDINCPSLRPSLINNTTYTRDMNTVIHHTSYTTTSCSVFLY